MSKRTFRIVLAAYLVFETAVALYYSFFGMRVPDSIVRRLYVIFGQPVSIPPSVLVTVSVILVLLFLWTIIGLFLFWRGARPVFVLLLLAFAAIAPLKPFYLMSGSFEAMMHLRLLAHGFLICLIYFGTPSEYFARKSA
jgi:hypothetical protein